jgi:DNA repair exonuclease SbcCD ATPase subunit
MLRIKSVSARNFLSVGNVTQAVKFDTNNLTLILGNNLDLGGDGSRNGTGKTTIINALSYGLYGDALEDIKKDNLINKSNAKNMMVTVDFELSGRQYRIERGRRPNVLNFFVDGVGVADNEGQGDSRETQKHIEQIIGFSHTMFKHIVALNTYTIPFLQMRNNDQRDMIEQLLGITEISHKAEVLKERLKETRDQIKEEEIRISAQKSANERIEKSIKDITLRAKAWETQRTKAVADFQRAAAALQEISIEDELEKHVLIVDIVSKEHEFKNLQYQLKHSTDALARGEKSLTKLKSELAASKTGNCHACGQDITGLDTHAQHVKVLEDKINEETAALNPIRESVDRTSKEIFDLGDIPERPSTFYDDVADAHAHKHNLQRLIEQAEDKAKEQNPYLDQIENLKTTSLVEISFDRINDLNYLKEHQEFLYRLLTSKDSFIRKKIIDQNLAYLNHRLAHYLESMGLPHEVRFLSDLSIEIMDLGRELDFAQLSRGERNRLILSLSWAFRDIYESLNHPLNLLCIDELIDNGLDSTGVEMALGVLKKMSRERNRSVFLVSHREELVGRVNSVLMVVKSQGFTEYSTDTEYME